VSENNPSESLINTWAQTQQKLLTNWLDTMQRFSGTASPELWTKTVDAWQASVKQTLDTQEEWIRQWTVTLANTKGVPQELQDLARQGQEQLQRWIEVERQLWQNWFNIVKDINFKVEPGTSVQAGSNLLQLWQETAQKMIEAQTGLARQWTSGFTGTKTNE
jgi:hypothetical protein